MSAVTVFLPSPVDDLLGRHRAVGAGRAVLELDGGGGAVGVDRPREPRGLLRDVGRAAGRGDRCGRRLRGRGQRERERERAGAQRPFHGGVVHRPSQWDQGSSVSLHPTRQETACRGAVPRFHARCSVAAAACRTAVRVLAHVRHQPPDPPRGTPAGRAQALRLGARRRAAARAGRGRVRRADEGHLAGPRDARLAQRRRAPTSRRWASARSCAPGRWSRSRRPTTPSTRSATTWSACSACSRTSSPTARAR